MGYYCRSRKCLFGAKKVQSEHVLKYWKPKLGFKVSKKAKKKFLFVFFFKWKMLKNEIFELTCVVTISRQFHKHDFTRIRLKI